MASTATKSLETKPLKIALVHDYLREYGGAERVLEALHQLFPEAPVYTAFVDEQALGIHWAKFADWNITQTWLAKVPAIKKLYSPLRVLAAKAFAELDLSAFDVVISSSNAYEAKAVVVPNGVHVCYCHTPPRALYGYATMTDWKKNPLLRLGGSIINHYMRVIDVKVAQKVDFFIANSRETQERIRTFYRRESQVIFPPVELPKTSQPEQASETEYYLYVNRLALAKHPELAVAACSQLGRALQVVGSGPLLPALKESAGPTVTFQGAVTDERLHQLYAGAKALLYPVEDEDFGIVPVEAMGHGVPVIAHRSGGPTETVIEGKTGVFFDQLTSEGLQHAMQQFEELAASKTFSRSVIRHHAEKFSTDAFQQKIQALVAKVTKTRQ